ncbi:sarcosine dehydrogenase, mitochondrial-like [Sycon ciliatum]|uniref:sarcosine dehydrogenase, mitochondrial-like n=1 Tax=Sycon ciliatum TaxID=27933 RepID=UPI0031F64460
MASMKSAFRIAAEFYPTQLSLQQSRMNLWKSGRSYSRAFSTSNVRGDGSGPVPSAVPYDRSGSNFDSAATGDKLPSSADAVIIGGGVAGCSALYHLTKLGMKNVVLLDRSKLTAGTTWHSAGLVWRLRLPDTTIQLMTRTRDLLVDTSETSLQAESGVDAGWVQNGTLFVATQNDRLDIMKRTASMGHAVGIESSVISPAEAKEIHPFVNVDDVVGAVYSPGDGIVEPAGLVSAYSRAAVRNGAKIFEDCPVLTIETSKEGFHSSRQVSAVHTDRGTIRTQCVLNCGGAWAPYVGAMVGVNVPLYPVRHHYVVTDSIEGMRGLPHVRDYDQSIYFKTHGDAVSFGGYEKDAIFIDDIPKDFDFSLYDLDWDVFSQHMTAAMHRMPSLEKVRLKSTVCGPESFTPDHYPLVGESPEVRGFYVSCGFNSSGIMLSGGIGQQIAEWIIHGKPSLDMCHFDIQRFGAYARGKTWLRERCHEEVATKDSVKYPNDQPLASRNMIKDPLHKELLKEGCVYEVSNGWERPGYFWRQGAIPDLKILPYDYCGAYGHGAHVDYPYRDALMQECSFTDHPGSHKSIGQECEATHKTAALYNLSSFGKLLVQGRDAQLAIDWLCSNNVRQEGKAAFSCMLNKQGGVEAEVMVTPLSADLHQFLVGSPPGGADNDSLYYVVCGGSTLTHVQCHMQRAIQDQKFDAAVQDVTSNIGVLSLQGPRSTEILQQLTKTDLSVAGASGMGTQFTMDIVGRPALAMRVPYLGQSGYELHITMDSLLQVYEQLMKVPDSGLVNAGFRAMKSVSLEWNHCSWGADLGGCDTPVEAGLGSTCSQFKDYLGKEVVDEQLQNGITRRRVLLAGKPENGGPLLGSEPVYRDGKVVSYTRRAEYSHLLNTNLASAYIPVETATTNAADFAKGRFEIERMGERFPAELFLKAPIKK